MQIKTWGTRCVRAALRSIAPRLNAHMCHPQAGETPLLHAAKAGNVHVLECLLAEKGIEVDKASLVRAFLGFQRLNSCLATSHRTNCSVQEGETPLIAATRADYPDCVQLLLARGANRTKENRRSESAGSLARGNSCRVLFWGSAPSEAGSAGRSSRASTAPPVAPPGHTPLTEGQTAEVILSALVLKLSREFAELKDDPSVAAKDRKHFEAAYDELTEKGVGMGPVIAELYSPAAQAVLQAATNDGKDEALLERLHGAHGKPPPNGNPEAEGYPDGKMHCRYVHLCDIMWEDDVNAEPTPFEQADAVSKQLLTSQALLMGGTPPTMKQVDHLTKRLRALIDAVGKNGSDRGYSPIFLLSEPDNRMFRGFALVSWLLAASRVKAEDVDWLRRRSWFNTRTFPLTSTNPVLHKEAGDAAMQLNKLEMAKQYYERSIELEPSSAAYSNLVRPRAESAKETVSRSRHQFPGIVPAAPGPAICGAGGVHPRGARGGTAAGRAGRGHRRGGAASAPHPAARNAAALPSSRRVSHPSGRRARLGSRHRLLRGGRHALPNVARGRRSTGRPAHRTRGGAHRPQVQRRPSSHLPVPG